MLEASRGSVSCCGCWLLHNQFPVNNTTKSNLKDSSPTTNEQIHRETKKHCSCKLVILNVNKWYYISLINGYCNEAVRMALHSRKDVFPDLYEQSLFI